MKQEKGFTLVELLAVIVILAIVLIIAVPGVLSIINQTKDNALDRQKDMIKEASRLYVTSDTDVTWVGQTTKMTTVSLDTLKAKGYLDQKMMDPKTKKEITCAKTTVTKRGAKYEYDVQFCDQVNASPRLSSNMIPIVYNGSTWVKADPTNQGNKWFNYDTQQWANVATVTEATRDAYKKANVGSEIKMDDINGMYVWIPRFKYKLFNVDGSVSPVGNPNMASDYMIDIQLENASVSKSKGTQNGDWLTHPAFTFGGEELEGFWMAKFELGYSGSTADPEIQPEQTDPNNVIIKPSAYALRNSSVSQAYDTIQAMKNNPVFGLDNGNDPHMIRNLEWGAMVYLTESKYGKTGNSNYIGAEKKVKLNNNKQRIVGCGQSSQEGANPDICNTYDTADGQAASTTGNITGIYDTSGGGFDCTAGVIKHESGKDYEAGASGFSSDILEKIMEQGKYIDSYEYNESNENMAIGKLGDATKEMGPFTIVQSAYHVNAWYQENSRMPYKKASFFRRSGSYGSWIYAGPASFMPNNGSANANYFDNAYRSVIL